jgi:redox-sensing transcriptional repressor
MSKQISLPTLKRLPNYYYILCQAVESGEKYISSATMSKLLDIDDTQVRKDIAATGYVGKPKVGFDINDFKSHLECFLGLNESKEAFLIGAGNLGMAFARYEGFKKYGLKITALFDVDIHKIGSRVANKEIFHISKLPDLVNRMNVDIAILTVPAIQAQTIADVLVECGIKAIWNFAPAAISVPEGIIVSNQDLASSFVTLSLMIARQQN